MIQKNNNKYLALDWGSEALKSLVFDDDKIIKKEISFSDKLSIPKDIDKIFVMLSDEEIVKTEYIRKDFTKKIDKKEERKILAHISNIAKNKCFKIPDKIKIESLKIDGYSVDELIGYKGHELKFNMYCGFKPEKIIDSPRLEFIHQSSLIKDISDNLNIVDIGGSKTKIFNISDSKIESIKEIDFGGQYLTKEIAKHLGIEQDQARLLKHKYSKNRLFKSLTDTIHRKAENLLTSVDIDKNSYFIGGGSQDFAKFLNNSVKDKQFKNLLLLANYVQKKNI